MSITTTTTTAVVETMARQPPSSSSSGGSLSIREILSTSGPSTGGPAPASPDDGFYSAAMFDTAEEEAFIQAQRDAFTAISDAALARALQESELLARRKAAEENRPRAASGSGFSSAGSASRASASAVHAAPAPVSSRYALWSPSEQGVPLPHPRKEAPAAAPRSSPPPAVKPFTSTSQPSSTSSSLSLSYSSSPPSRTSATTLTHRPLATERQVSSRPIPSQRQQPQPATSSVSYFTSATTAASASTSRPTGLPALTSSSPMTYTSNFYSSNIPSTSASGKASSPPVPRPTTRATSKTASLPTWQPAVAAPSVAAPSTSTQPRPIPTASARDLRMGVLAVPSRPVEVTSSGAKLTSQGRPASAAQAPPIRPRPKAPPAPPRRTARRAGRRAPSESEIKLAHAREFLNSNLESECPKCGEDVEGPEGSAPIPSEPFSHNLLKYTHVTCSNAECGASFCRGCFAPVEGRCRPTDSSSTSSSASSSASSSPAPSRKASPSRPTSSTTPSCRGSRGCDIKSCCAFASVVAIASILDALDAECVKAAGASGFASPASNVREAEAFVNVVIARSDVKNTRVFEGVVIRALHAMSSWLQILGERLEDDEDKDDGETRGLDPVRDLLHPLVKHSLLPSLVRSFLQNRNVGDWLRHSEIYVLILEVLRRLVDRGLGKVLDEPIVVASSSQRQEVEGKTSLSAPYHWRSGSLGSGEESSTSESSGGEDEDDSSESDGGTETDNTSPDERDDDDEDTEDENEGKRRTWNASDYIAASQRMAAGQQLTIKALVSKLEEHRGPLMAVGANVKFPATKMKVHTLCDGISYLLLQQVIAMD